MGKNRIVTRLLTVLIAAIVTPLSCTKKEGSETTILMELSQQSAQFSLPAGSIQTPSIKITVKRVPDSTFGSLTVTEDAAWIQTTKTTGLSPDTVRITVFATGLAGGAYIDTVSISTSEAANSPQLVEVRLAISNTIVLGGNSLTFTALSNGPNPPTQQVAITSGGGNPINVEIADNQSWLNLNPITGATPVNLQVSPDMTGLSGGRYGGQIEVSAAQATNSPLSISWSLFVSSWSAATVAVSYDLGDSYFVNATTGYAVGFIGNNPEFSGAILKTTDGGASWGINKIVTPGAFSGVWFPSEQNGFAVGDSAAIWFTTNGGGNWTRFPLSSLPVDESFDFWSVEFFDSQNGWIVGTGGLILATTNGGASWQRQTSPSTLSLASIEFESASEGWIVGNGGFLLHTTNGGLNWSQQVSGTNKDIWGVSFIDLQSGIAVGDDGLLLRTSDGGINWNPGASQELTRLQDVVMISSTEGWFAGQGGVIRYTSDGGATWIAQQSGVSSWLFSLFAIDNQKVWAAGEDGTLLRTLSGGF